MVGFLSYSQLEFLVQLYNRWLTGEQLDTIHWGDFYALPNKLQHGPIANARPLLNFNSIWKILSTALKQHVSSPLCKAHIIPPTQFALWGKASAIDTIRVVHNHVLHRWFLCQTVFIILDERKTCVWLGSTHHFGKCFDSRRLSSIVDQDNHGGGTAFYPSYGSVGRNQIGHRKISSGYRTGLSHFSLNFLFVDRIANQHHFAQYTPLTQTLGAYSGVSHIWMIPLSCCRN